jgi:YD repeat-containing protein
MQISRNLKSTLQYVVLVMFIAYLGFELDPQYASAQQSKINYVYDDLGRLVRVIDEGGNAATYHYDAVGNLLRITRESSVPTTTVVTSLSSSSWNRGTTGTVSINGYNLSCSSVTTAAFGVVVSNFQRSLDQIVITATVSDFAVTGPAALEITCEHGVLTVPISIFDSPPTVAITSPQEGASVMEGGEVTLTAEATDNVRVGAVVWTVEGTTYPAVNTAPYRLVAAVPLDVQTVTVEAQASDNFGQTSVATRIVAVQPDPPPAVSITSPAEGTTAIAGGRLTVTAEATDNRAVTQVVWSVNGVAETAVTTWPYLREILIPTGVSSLTLVARATDDFGRTATSSRTLAVIPDPGTTVAGRILDSSGQPVSGASIKVFEQSVVSRPDGTFTIASVPTIRGPILVYAELQVAGLILRGESVVVLPVAGETTDVGTITLRPVDNSTYPALAQFTGEAPGSVAIIDLNGDGKMDLVTANEGTTSDISVILAGGNGTFLPAQSYPAGDGGWFNGPQSIATGDLNGDGRIDLLTANPASDSLSIFFGNGDGTFQNQQRFEVGDNPLYVAAADVNADGKLDMVSANSSSRDVSVILGNGDGSFRPQLRYTAGNETSSGPVSVAAADTNGDGRVDVISRIGGSNDLSILLGNGDGTFQSQLRVPTGASPLDLVVTDLNGDSLTDIVVTTSTNLASVILGSGNGNFQTPESYPVGTSPVSLLTMDVNGDGIADIVTANLQSRDISVLLGIGNGSFQVQQRFSTSTGPNAIAAGRIDADNTVDVALAMSGSDMITLLYGNGNGTFRSRQTVSVGDAPLAVTVADLNSDDKLDIVAANGLSNDLSVLFSTGDNTYQSQQRLLAGTRPAAVMTADLNGDGNLDIIAANSGSDDISVVLGTGNGMFGVQQRYEAGDFPSAMLVHDFNADGKLDLVTANGTSRDLSVFLGNGDGTFQPQQRVAAGDRFFGPRAIASCDLNGDGRLDLVVVRNLEGDGDNVLVFIGNGDGSFQLPQPYQGGTGTRSVAAVDLNGDGSADVVVANAFSNDVTIFFGNGDGTLQLAEQIPIDGGQPALISARDVNGDGKIDLVLANSSRTVAVLYGNGTGAFQNPQYFTAGSVLRGLSVGDLNSDGQFDILTVDELSDEVAILLRQ